jgi:diguanylate cyclase (GGDEF)-like protein
VLQLSVAGPDPETASLLANNLSERAIEYIKELYLIYNLNLFDPAIPPKTPISPQPARNAAVAVVLGFVLGCVLALLREHLRQPMNQAQTRMNIDKSSSAYSRRYFKNRLETELTRNQAGDLSLGVIELEGLPDLKETLSKPAYERLLRQVKAILQDELRGKDVIGRWDETCFAVLLPGLSGSTAIQQFESVQHALSAPISLDQDHTVQLKPYTGVAALQDSEGYALGLIEQAETALKRAHRNGRNLILFTKELSQPYHSTEHKNGSNSVKNDHPTHAN